MWRALLSLVAAALASSSLLLGGCLNLGEGTVSPTRLYLLEPMTPPAASAAAPAASNRITIGIGPVTIPPHLDRPQLLIRTNRHQFNLAEFAQWAEPLRENMSRVLVENLSALLPNELVTEFPRRVPVPVDYQVAVRVIRFDAALEGDATLQAQWGIFGRAEDDLLHQEKTTYQERAGSTDPEAIVAAKSRALEMLCRDIAEAIQSLHSGPGSS